MSLEQSRMHINLSAELEKSAAVDIDSNPQHVYRKIEDALRGNARSNIGVQPAILEFLQTPHNLVNVYDLDEHTETFRSGVLMALGLANLYMY